jgi:hypothetical protein
MNGARVNSATQFELQYRASGEVPAVPCVELIGPVTVACQVTTRDPHTVTCTFQTELAGTYQLRVTFADLTIDRLAAPLPAIHVHAADSDARNSFCEGLGTCVALVNQVTTFTVVTRDLFDNPLQRGGAQLAVQFAFVSGAQSDVNTLIEQVLDDEAWTEHEHAALDEDEPALADPLAAQDTARLTARPVTPSTAPEQSVKDVAAINQTVRVIDEQSGRYSVSYAVHLPGKFQLAVTVLESGTRAHVFGSPFELTVLSGESHSALDLQTALATIQSDIVAFTEQQTELTARLLQVRTRC